MTTYRSKSLFDLTSEMLELEARLSDFDGDVTDEDKEREIDELLATFETTGDEFKRKVDSYLYLIAETRHLAEGRKAESKRLADLAASGDKNADTLEERLSVYLKALGKTDFQTNLHKLKFVKNGGKLPITYLFDNLAEVPVDYQFTFQEQRLDKEFVREELEAGKTLPFAVLEDRKERLKVS